MLFILALAQFRYPFADRGLNLAWDGGCLALALVGQAVRFFTVGFVPRGTSGRNTRGQVAETLNTTGMYAVVRNPIYLGNFIIWFGLSLFMKSVWFTTVIVLFFTIFYERIIFREEAFLRQKFGDAFMEWADATPVIMPRSSRIGGRRPCPSPLNRPLTGNTAPFSPSSPPSRSWKCWPVCSTMGN